MKRILFYYPSNKRSIQIETTLIALKNKGHTITLLTTCEKGDLHLELEKNEIQTFQNVVNTSNSVLYYLKQIRILQKMKIETL